MQHAISQVMKCTRLSKNRSSRPVYQLAASGSTGNHLKSSLYTVVYQPVNHRSVIIGARQPISQLSGILHHSDDSVGPFLHDTSVCRSQRGSNLGSTNNQKAQYVLRASLQRRLRPPSKYQSKEQLKENPAPPISFKTTAGIDRNLGKKSGSYTLTSARATPQLNKSLAIATAVLRYNTSSKLCWVDQHATDDHILALTDLSHHNCFASYSTVEPR
ncbi:hypothetical protein F511_14639 [Dorcoceras hygrometricum]|uniref:Uncharacterized protein n=1 Tax=Dorcoceras hygrometricum TaxID=472368 RepID=A0A2Z7DAE4_9LAMI|nr:hypothetical protein F511_14639 [Dorcoceras hygrometricum]